jgi:hypothetical protein
MQKSPCKTEAYSLNLAEREGFEPSLGLTLNTLSRRAPSAVITSRVVALPIQLKATLCSDDNNKVYS